MQNGEPQLDASAELHRIGAIRKSMRKKRRWGKSCLIPFRAELVTLRRAGGSLGDIQTWLLVTHRIAVERSTILRFLAKLPEVSANG